MTDIGQAGGPQGLSIRHRVVDGIRVVTVRGEIDKEVEDLFHEALLPADGLMAPARIVVDLSGVTFMDSSGINVFVTAHQRVSDAQGWLRIAGARESVVHVLHIVGLDTLISCHPTVEHALNV
ncbi:STAS domain-containing protein [Streptomyces sp. MBT65]|uniref:STAS domain-containing protein n=1 Tax=Streptomyces sp. MBT65 TaxID=1488395 RepID=UPI00190D2826|nr:STAS domain-containing protein [Streptomyces sp. MBT65]MBK3575680.1 STAS domain-containing protein [Streptomyces sp. MBT65]